MNKRQLKKNEKKYIPIIADEAILLTMTEDEQKRAFENYMMYRKKYAYRKKYKDLKNAKPLLYFYSLGNSGRQFSEKLGKRARKGYSAIGTQALDEKTRSLLEEAYISRPEADRNTN
ncbi:hypothetical protein [Brevibacillus reuszeri]|uniref:hypothetical protein n=1 Tax=Brevibacillus reuszeri TaxID=54915 RepID=UPI000CCC60FF|nr:hypothetical protein [Brevibacillus reuszeri]